MAKNKFNIDKTLDFEIEFFEKLLQNNPNEITILIPLGDAYTKRELYEKGLSIDKKLVSLKPDEPIFYYNLACSFSLLKKKNEAIRALRKTLKLGYRDFEHIMKDSDLNNIHSDTRFKILIKKYSGFEKKLML